MAAREESEILATIRAQFKDKEQFDIFMKLLDAMGLTSKKLGEEFNKLVKESRITEFLVKCTKEGISTSDAFRALAIETGALTKEQVDALGSLEGMTAAVVGVNQVLKEQRKELTEAAKASAEQALSTERSSKGLIELANAAVRAETSMRGLSLRTIKSTEEFDRAAQAFRKTQQETEKVSGGADKLGGKVAILAHQMTLGGRYAYSLQGALSSLFGQAAAGVGIVAALTAVMVKATQETMVWANSIYELALLTGTTIREVQQLGAVTEYLGEGFGYTWKRAVMAFSGHVDTLYDDFSKLTPVIDKSGSTIGYSTEKLAKWGVALVDTSYKQRGFVDILTDMRKMYNLLPDSIERTAMMKAHFGFLSADVIKVLQLEEETWQRVIEAYRVSGRMLGEDQVQAAVVARREFELLKASIKGLTTEATIPFADSLGKTYRILNEMIFALQSSRRGSEDASTGMKILGYSAQAGTKIILEALQPIKQAAEAFNTLRTAIDTVYDAMVRFGLIVPTAIKETTRQMSLMGEGARLATEEHRKAFIEWEAREEERAKAAEKRAKFFADQWKKAGEDVIKSAWKMHQEQEKAAEKAAEKIAELLEKIAAIPPIEEIYIPPKMPRLWEEAMRSLGTSTLSIWTDVLSSLETEFSLRGREAGLVGVELGQYIQRGMEQARAGVSYFLSGVATDAGGAMSLMGQHAKAVFEGLSADVTRILGLRVEAIRAEEMVAEADAQVKRLRKLFDDERKAYKKEVDIWQERVDIAQARVDVAQRAVKLIRREIEAARRELANRKTALQDFEKAIEAEIAERLRLMGIVLDPLRLADLKDAVAEARRSVKLEQRAIKEFQDAVEAEVQERLAALGLIIDPSRMEDLKAAVEDAKDQVSEAQDALTEARGRRQRYGLTLISWEEINAQAALEMAQSEQRRAEASLRVEQKREREAQRVRREIEAAHADERKVLEARLEAAQAQLESAQRVLEDEEELWRIGEQVRREVEKLRAGEREAIEKSIQIAEDSLRAAQDRLTLAQDALDFEQESLSVLKEAQAEWREQREAAWEARQEAMQDEIEAAEEAAEVAQSNLQDIQDQLAKEETIYGLKVKAWKDHVSAHESQRKEVSRRQSQIQGYLTDIQKIMGGTASDAQSLLNSYLAMKTTSTTETGKQVGYLGTLKTGIESYSTELDSVVKSMLASYTDQLGFWTKTGELIRDMTRTILDLDFSLSLELMATSFAALRAMIDEINEKLGDVLGIRIEIGAWKPVWSKAISELLRKHEEWLVELRERYPMPSMQRGGFIGQTGPYHLHKGELVLSTYQWRPLMEMFRGMKMGTTFAPLFNVNVEVKGLPKPLDVRVSAPSFGLSEWSRHW